MHSLFLRGTVFIQSMGGTSGGVGDLSCLSCDTQQPQYHCKKIKKTSQKILTGSATNTITNITNHQLLTIKKMVFCSVFWDIFH